MRKLLTILASVLFVASAAMAQEYQVPEIKVSHDRVSVDGKLYYAHVVTDRQTLYSISKAYNVPLSEIYQANRNLDLEKSGLKSGQVLLIPIGQRTSGTILPSGEQEHPSEPSGRPAGSGGNDGSGQVAENSAQDNLRAQDGKSGISSFLKWLFNGIFKGGVNGDSLEFRVEMPDTIKVAVILPFSKSKFTRNSVDFYCGQLIAARDFGKKEDIPLDIKAFDLNDSSEPFSDSLNRYNIVFGPTSVADMKRCLDICPEGMFMISPLDPHTDTLTTNNLLIHTPTPAKRQNGETVRWLMDEYEAGDEVVLLRSDGALSETARTIIDELKGSGLKYSEICYNFLQGRNIRSSYEARLSKTGTTRFVLASEDESFMNDAVRNVSLMSYKHKVVLYAPSKLRSYTAIETENLHNAGSHVCAAYFTDYNSHDVSNFVMAYRALYGTEPNSFAIHGYDTMHYFLNICRIYGKQWPLKLAEYKERGLQTDFDFVQTPDGKGFINQAVRRIEYLDDFSIVLK